MLSTDLPRLRLHAAASATSVLSYVFHAAATMTLPCRRIECQLTYPKPKAHAIALRPRLAPEEDTGRPWPLPNAAIHIATD